MGENAFLSDLVSANFSSYSINPRLNNKDIFDVNNNYIATVQASGVIKGTGPRDIQKEVRQDIWYVTIGNIIPQNEDHYLIQDSMGNILGAIALEGMFKKDSSIFLPNGLRVFKGRKAYLLVEYIRERYLQQQKKSEQKTTTTIDFPHAFAQIVGSRAGQFD